MVPSSPQRRWRTHGVGGGALVRTEAGLRFVVPAGRSAYANAQLDDYSGLPRRAFPSAPPLSLTLRARFSHEAGALRGTAGFGFWNDPFMMSGTWPPALPQAAWFFFAAPPSNMLLAPGVPGHGWKAATLNAQRPAARLLLPLAPFAPLLLRSRRLYAALWPHAARALAVHERTLALEMRVWHTYRLDWLPARLLFSVDGQRVLETQCAPDAPLGLVVWMDNQYLVATPQGKLRAGVVPLPETQWLEIADLRVEQER